MSGIDKVGGEIAVQVPFGLDFSGEPVRFTVSPVDNLHDQALVNEINIEDYDFESGITKLLLDIRSKASNSNDHENYNESLTAEPNNVTFTFTHSLGYKGYSDLEFRQPPNTASMELDKSLPADEGARTLLDFAYSRRAEALGHDVVESEKEIGRLKRIERNAARTFLAGSLAVIPTIAFSMALGIDEIYDSNVPRVIVGSELALSGLGLGVYFGVNNDRKREVQKLNSLSKSQSLIENVVSQVRTGVVRILDSDGEQ